MRRVAPRGLPVRFVTRMSVDLNHAIAAAAKEDGITAAAWVRRLLLDRFAMISPSDERSGRPVRRAAEDVVAISNAIRHLADVSGAVSVGNRSAAQDALQRARGLLIPLVVRRPE
ncbi:MAG: hypothetical protein PGN25_04180 [Methylorubrum populi]